MCLRDHVAPRQWMTKINRLDDTASTNMILFISHIVITVTAPTFAFMALHANVTTYPLILVLTRHFVDVLLSAEVTNPIAALQTKMV